MFFFKCSYSSDEKNLDFHQPLMSVYIYICECVCACVQSWVDYLQIVVHY